MAVSRTAPENRSYDMAQPSPYNRAFNFSNYQAGSPTTPLPGSQVDIELSRVKLVTDQIRAALASIQRDDLALANRSVGIDQLKAEVTIGINSPTAWATATTYIANDTVFYQYKFYKCLSSHTSGTFSTDLAASKWLELADFSATQQSALILYDNTTSGLTATNMQAAMDELVASVLVTSVHGRAGNVVAASGDYDADQITFDPTGLTMTDATDLQEALEDIDAAAQPLDADLTAIAGLSSAGLVARVGSGSASARTITGTSNRITVTNGDGVSGNPTLDVGSTVALLGTEDQALTGGAAVTSKQLGTAGVVSSGTVTVDVGDRPLQDYTNNGAHSLDVSSAHGVTVLDITNGASAGAITTSAFAKVTGDAFTTTNGHKFTCTVKNGPAGKLLFVQAMQ